MSHFCDDCDHLHTAGDTVAIGRFTSPIEAVACPRCFLRRSLSGDCGCDS